MSKNLSLADVLAVGDPRSEEARQLAEELPSEPTLDGAVDISDPKAFCERILASREFRQYIMHGIVIGDLPPAIVARVMDHGWGKPPEKHEHTGANGEPIKTVTEVRRVIVRPKNDVEMFADDAANNETEERLKVTH